MLVSAEGNLKFVAGVLARRGGQFSTRDWNSLVGFEVPVWKESPVIFEFLGGKNLLVRLWWFPWPGRRGPGP